MTVTRWRHMATLKGPERDADAMEIWLSRANGVVTRATWFDSREGDEGFALDDGHVMEWQVLPDGVATWVIQWADEAGTKEFPNAWMMVEAPPAYQIGEPLDQTS